MRARPFSVEERAAELELQELDRAQQGGSTDVAFLGCPREIEMLCSSQEVANLVHFHVKVAPELNLYDRQ
jgi:hypothetical protein